jgi:hypothetical protein
VLQEQERWERSVDHQLRVRQMHGGDGEDNQTDEDSRRLRGEEKMKFRKLMKPIIIEGHEAVEYFKSKKYSEKRKTFHELNGFHVILRNGGEIWNNKWFVCVNNQNVTIIEGKKK